MFSFDNGITVVIAVITHILRHFFLYFLLINKKNDINFINILKLKSKICIIRFFIQL